MSLISVELIQHDPKRLLSSHGKLLDVPLGISLGQAHTGNKRQKVSLFGHAAMLLLSVKLPAVADYFASGYGLVE